MERWIQVGLKKKY